jgi:hypothetical protein
VAHETDAGDVEASCALDVVGSVVPWRQFAERTMVTFPESSIREGLCCLAYELNYVVSADKTFLVFTEDAELLVVIEGEVAFLPSAEVEVALLHRMIVAPFGNSAAIERILCRRPAVLDDGFWRCELCLDRAETLPPPSFIGTFATSQYAVEVSINGQRASFNLRGAFHHVSKTPMDAVVLDGPSVKRLRECDATDAVYRCPTDLEPFAVNANRLPHVCKPHDPGSITHKIQLEARRKSMVRRELEALQRAEECLPRSSKVSPRVVFSEGAEDTSDGHASPASANGDEDAVSNKNTSAVLDTTDPLRNASPRPSKGIEFLERASSMRRVPSNVQLLTKRASLSQAGFSRVHPVELDEGP